MRTFQAFASILLYTASALGDAAPGPIPASPSTAATPTAVVKGHDPADLPALYTPPPGPMPDAAQLSGDVTIGITNQLVGTPVITIVGAHDANALGARTPVNGQFTQTTNIVVPSGWAGAFTVDKVGAPFNTLGSRFEGNWGVNDPANLVYIDVSYVTGFSVAMVCSCGNDPHATPVTGCNKNLYDLNSCPTGQSQGNSASPVCVNDSGTNGPPQAFFAPCQGGAYTYPNDNGAVGACNTNHISCCMGVSCPANPRQPSGPTKRDSVAKRMAARRGLGAQIQEDQI